VLALFKEIAFPPPKEPSKSIAQNAAVNQIYERTPNFFVNEYLKRYAFTDEHRHFRLFSRDDDDDVDDEGFATTPRHPRHVSRYEVLGVFASVAEWILADSLLMKTNLFKQEVDAVAWYEFIRKVVRPGRCASKGEWGMPYGMEFDPDDHTGEVDLYAGKFDFNIKPEEMKAKLKARRARRIKEKALVESSNARAGSSSPGRTPGRQSLSPAISESSQVPETCLAASSPERHSSVRSMSPEFEDSFNEQIPDDIYLSDVTDESSIDEDSSTDNEVPTDPSIFTQIPRQFFCDPKIPK
jgi:hypothetical protein